MDVATTELYGLKIGLLKGLLKHYDGESVHGWLYEDQRLYKDLMDDDVISDVIERCDWVRSHISDA